MDDVVIACAELTERAGAQSFELGYMHEDATRIEDAGWYAMAYYQGVRLMTDEHQSPAEAALALAFRLMTGATCRCGDPVTLADGSPGCRWRLNGPHWEPGCDAPPITVHNAERGDLDAMRAAMDEQLARGDR